MKTTRAIFACALAACAVGVITQGCSGTSGGSGFDNGGGGAGGGGADGSAGGGDGGINFGDASFHTDGGGVDLGDAGCATATASASRQPVYMLIVLDGSGSMNQNRDGTMSQKWTAVVPALDAFFTDPTAMNDPGFGVGLTIFSDKNDPQCNAGFIPNCVGPYSAMNVPIAKVDATQSAALKARIDPTAPNDGTPTYAVLQGQYPALEAFNPASGHLDPNGKKVLVLMTDGVPNGGASEQNQCITLTTSEAAKSPPVTTFVVGVGNYNPLNTQDYDPAFLGHLAQAGGAPRAGCDPTNTNDETKMCHFQVTPGNKTAQQLEQDFLNAINAIRGQVASCTFALQNSGGTVDPTKVNVVYNDGSGNKTTVPQDGTNGWTYDNPTSPTSVTLHGTSCSTMKANSKGSISIVLGCATVYK
jgi:hypothetical protein